MAKREELRLDVEVKGAKDVDKLADSFDDVEDASKKAAKSLVADWDKVGAQAKETAAIMKTIGDALGADAGKFDLKRIATGMQQAGIDAKGAAANVDLLADGLRRLDDAKTSISDLGDGLGKAKTGTDEMAQSAHGANSAMANMVGNATQDLGVLGGVAGSAGVAIGQMAEYASDAAFSGEKLGSVIKNMATVAGPIAGIAAGMALVQYYMDGIAKAKAFNKQEAEDYAEAIQEIGEGAGTVLSHLEEAGKIEFAVDSGLLSMGTAIKDATELLDKYGITASEISRVVAGTEDEQLAWAAALRASGINLADQNEILLAVNSQIDAYNAGLERAESVNAVFAATTGDANAALAEMNETQGLVTDSWASVLDDMERNGQITDASITQWNRLRTELGLTDQQMAEMTEQKLDEKLEADAAALEEAAAEALRLNQALADLGDTIDTIDTDDFANISGALESELNKVDDIFAGLKFDVDFQPALNEALDGLSSFAPDLQTLADEWAGILEGKPIDIFGNVRADDAEFQAKMAELSNLFQEGVVNAFDQGGVEAANTFVQSAAAQIASRTGLDIAEVYRIMGLPPDGNIDAIVKPSVDAEAAADAMAILDALMGVDPNNPILAYIRLGVQTDDIDPQVAEIAARLLAAEALGIPAKLEEFTQADIDEATRLIANTPVEMSSELDPSGAEDGIADVERGDYQATIGADADTQEAARQLLDETTRQRQATIYAIAAITSAKAALDSLTDRRIASILAVAFTAGAEYELNYTARRRDSYIYQHVVPVGGGGGRGGGGGGGGATPFAAPAAAPMAAPMAFGVEEEEGAVATLAAAPATMSSGIVSSSPAISMYPLASPVTNNLQVTVQAAVIGNRHEVERTVAKALRSYTRLNGSRN